MPTFNDMPTFNHMPTFNDMLGAVRDDCDTTRLAGSAQLRRLGDRRTHMHRTIGGAAVLVLAGGVATGVAVYGSGGAAVGHLPASSGASATSRPPAQVQVGQPTPSATQVPGPPPASAGQKQPVPPAASPPSTSTGPGGVAACAAADFDVAHATITEDDASGIQGYDIVIKYTGTKSCKLAQSAPVSYVDGSGHRVTIPLSFSAPAITVKPHTTVTTNVFGHTDAAINPPPAACAEPHVYSGLDIKIDGQERSLGSRTISLPCGGPESLPWTTP